MILVRKLAPVVAVGSAMWAALAAVAWWLL